MTAPRLTLADLHELARRYGGTLETHPRGFILRGCLIDGRRVDLGPAPGPVAVAVGGASHA